VTATSVEKVNGVPLAPEPRFDPVALAEAEAIRTRAAAEADALRAEAEGKAEAEKIRAAAEAEQLRLENEKQRMANERAALRFQREQAEQLAKIAEAERKREETERAREAARQQHQEQQQTEAARDKAVEESSKRWRRVAQGFYILCAAVALPVQMNAFYDENAKYLVVAPVFIELIALVALVGAAAAVTAGRPHWHYRLVAWLGALTAATINIVHGLAEYDPATAFGTALASIAGPGMWDLHEHGRIRKRDGKPSWRERRAQRKKERAEAAAKAADEKKRAAEKAAAEKAAEEERQRLAEERQREFPKVWAEAVKIAAAVGKRPDDPTVWAQAYRNIEGTEPGESIESITARRAAEKRVQAALTGTPVSTLSKTTNAQRAIQMNGSSRRSSYKPVPPRRTPGDTAPYHPLARRANGETKRRLNAAKQATEKKD
jgi:chemotaxis protein histidine kinase CheA